MAVETVIFLGAGASAADGAPVQNQLFNNYFEEPSRWEHGNGLGEFFRDFFGIDTRSSLRHALFPTFEEVLGVIELAISRGESMRGYSLTPHSPDLQLIREYLILLIAKSLRANLDSGGNGVHTSLVERLVSGGIDIRKTAFISLNYDILLDNALTERHDDVDLSYGVDFTNFGRAGDWHKPRKGRSINLYKLHGSLNWLYCPTCIALTITPKQKSVSTIAESPVACRKCSTHMIPIIIPPTFFKVMSNAFLQRIWSGAEDVLSRCRRLVFCGYSFPDADIHIKYLLKRVELNRGNTPEIGIFNSHPGKSDMEKEREENRYKRFFSKKQKVNYFDHGFEHFARHGW